MRGRTRAVRFGVPVAMCLAAWGVTWLLRAAIPTTAVSPLFSVAVVLSAWWGGRGPGILVAVLSAVLIQTTLLSEDFLSAVVGGGVRMAVFLALAGLASEAASRLARSWARLSGLFDATPSAVVVFDQEGRVEAWNASAERLFGWTQREVLGRADPTLAPEEVEAAAKLRRRVLTEGVVIRRDTVRRRRDSRLVEVGLSVVAMRNERGEITWVSEIMSDLTARRRAESALREREQALRRLMDSNVIGIVLTDLTGGILEANDSFLRTVQRSREDLLQGRVRWDEMTPPEYREVDLQAVRELQQAGAAHPREKEYLRPDGSRVPVLLGGALFDAELGQDIVFALDLSERKRTEAALRESEQRFRALSGTAPVGIFEMDAEGRCTYVNPRWEEIMQRAAAASLGWGWLDGVHPDDRESLGRTWKKAAPRVGEWTRETRIVTPGGQVRWVRARAIPRSFVGDRPTGWVGTLEDLTEDKRAAEERSELLSREQAARAEAQDANRTKDQFLAVLSHELRNPLAAISAGVEVLKRRLGRQDRVVEAAVDTIARNARLQTRLVDDLLDLSRVAQGKVQLRCEPLSLTSVLGAAVAAFEANAERAGVVLTLEAAPELQVLGDGDRLQQIVMNLLSNALKFTPRGGRVRVRSERAGDWARVVVEDTGVGIEPEVLPHIFDMFRQGEPSGRKGGLGIGLSLVRSLVSMHGGKVWAESAGKEQGSRFVVELPLMLERGAEAEERHPPPSA